MEESNAMRAITIGVSVFVAIITITGVLTYYGIVRDTAKNIGSGNDMGEKYSEEIENILLKGSYKGNGNSYLTGTEVLNLLNYFYKNENVRIDIENIKYVKDDGSVDKFLPYTHENVNITEDKFNEVYSKILSNQRFEIDNDESGTNKQYGSKKYIRYLKITGKDL